MKRFLTGLVLAGTLFINSFAFAQTVDGAPARLLAKQFNSNTEVFTTTNPDLSGTPLTLTRATGRTPANGVGMISLGAGFTGPATLTIFFWQRDNVSSAKAGWRRLGASASAYSIEVDNYSTATFVGPPNTPYLVLADMAITGNVYVTGPADPNNNNTATGGYPN